MIVYSLVRCDENIFYRFCVILPQSPNPSQTMRKNIRQNQIDGQSTSYLTSTQNCHGFKKQEVFETVTPEEMTNNA